MRVRWKTGRWEDRLLEAERRLTHNPHDFGATMAAANAIGAARKAGVDEDVIRDVRQEAIKIANEEMKGT